MKNEKPKLDIWGWVGLSPLILIGLLVLAFLFGEFNKSYWDYKVKKMCLEDGGVTVYETVFLSEAEFKTAGGSSYGQLVVPTREVARDRNIYPFYSERSGSELRSGSPRVYRSESKIFRKSDEKVLGRLTTYGRYGGDFPFSFNPSSFGCGNIEGFRLDIEKQIFIVEGV